MSLSQSTEEWRSSKECQQEIDTIRAIVSLHCRKKHDHPPKLLCSECEDLLTYCEQKIQYCPWGDKRGQCVTCKSNCFHPDYIKRIKPMMRWAGPRLIFYHPIKLLRHYLRR